MLTYVEVETEDRGIEVVESVSNGAAGDAVTAAFVCGWACADEAHLSALPEALVDSLGLDFAEVEIIPRVGAATRHAHPEGTADDARREGRFEFRGALRDQLTLRLYAQVSGERILTASQREVLGQIAQLARKMLESVLVRQHDRHALGHRFELLSDREWEVCRALEGVESEEQIATKLGRSKYTVHAHVKKVYATLGVTGRKQVIELLGKAREKLRIEALRGVCFQGQGESPVEN